MNDYSSSFQPDFSQFMQEQSLQPQQQAYPTLPNDYGIGSQQTVQQTKNPNNPQGQVNNVNSSFNPWSIGLGESGAR